MRMGMITVVLIDWRLVGNANNIEVMMDRVYSCTFSYSADRYGHCGLSRGAVKDVRLHDPF